MTFNRTCRDCPAQFPALGRRVRCASCQEIYKNSPEYKAKVRARSAVCIALVAGTIEKKPCEAIRYWDQRRCGREPVHAHHEDYSRPLDIVWLCAGCHHRRHYELKQSPVPPLLFERPGQPNPDRDW